MLYGPQLKSEKIEHKFNKEELKNEIKSKIKEWVILEGAPYCDLLLMRNFSIDALIKSNSRSFQPYEAVEKKIFQKIIAVDLKEKTEQTTMDLKSLRRFTTAQFDCDNIHSLMRILNNQLI